MWFYRKVIFLRIDLVLDKFQVKKGWPLSNIVLNKIFNKSLYLFLLNIFWGKLSVSTVPTVRTLSTISTEILWFRAACYMLASFCLHWFNWKNWLSKVHSSDMNCITFFTLYFLIPRYIVLYLFNVMDYLHLWISRRSQH